MFLQTAAASIGRLYPFLSGNFRLSGFFPKSSDLAWCPSPGGPLLVPLADEVGHCIFFTGDYDPKITWLCRKLLRLGDTALDIGANLGVVTLAMAKAVGSTGRVHAFEPNPKMIELLKQSIARSFQNITLHEMALGSQDAELELHVPPTNYGAASFIRFRDALHTTSVKCPVRKLSDVVAAEAVGAIRLIKIDVEGFENEVFLGGEDVLTKNRPDAVIIETNSPPELPFREISPIATLRRHDYRFLALPKAMFTMRVAEFDVEQQHAPPSHDVLAIPAEKYHSILELLR
jgi:FkbM family methyltransferase